MKLGMSVEHVRRCLCTILLPILYKMIGAPHDYVCDILHIPHHIQVKKRSIGCIRLRGSRRRGGALSPSMIPRWRLLDCRVEEIEEKERDLRSTEEGEERARAPKALTSG